MAFDTECFVMDGPIISPIPLPQVQADATDLPATGSDPAPAVGLRDLDVLRKVECMRRGVGAARDYVLGAVQCLSCVGRLAFKV